MSIRPLSTNQINTLNEIIENKGWNRKGAPENYFRYTIKKNKLFIFTIKFPLALPLKLNIPIELANFKISLALQLWNLNQTDLDIISYFLKKLRDFALQVSMEHDFNLKGKENKLVDLLNLFIPEQIKNENERSWLNRIRISLMNKRDKIKKLSTEEMEKIVKSLKELGLDPSFDVPWELKKGIPKLRVPETLFFSNDEEFDEFFILEKGYLSYFKDIKFKKIYARTFFESYMPSILNTLFQKDSEFNLTKPLENWVKFSRLLLNSVLNIIQEGNFNTNYFIEFRPEKELGLENFDDNNFPLTALTYESHVAKDLYDIHNDLLNRPPEHFEVLNSLKSYTLAEEMIKNYQFEEATNLLNESLKIFNKYQQKKVVVAILLKLTKVALTLNRTSLAVNYLKNALNVSKTGEIPLKFIIQIHFQLGKIYFNEKDLESSLKHFNIIGNFLENESVDFDKKIQYLGISYIYLGLIQSSNERLAKAIELFKKAFELSNKSKKVKLLYHLLRARYYKSKGNLSQAKKLLKMSVKNIDFDSIQKKYQNILIDLLLELAEYYIHHRKDSKKAMYFLNKVDKLTKIKTIPGLKKSIRWNLLMTDYYKFLENDSKKVSYYLKQSRILDSQLKKIGVQ
ncbi:MAG: Tetratricopeptide repeat protein [Promethearchaeota archaeon]|nr:MAG: Tetratricopeptide repeat protein [Candidatus Lokiarchaeota archaeon]